MKNQRTFFFKQKALLNITELINQLIIHSESLENIKMYTINVEQDFLNCTLWDKIENINTRIFVREQVIHFLSKKHYLHRDILITRNIFIVLAVFLIKHFLE